MIIDKFVTIKGHPRNFSFYKNLGYSPEIGKEFDVTPNHIKPGSPVIINCKCDNCDLKISMEYRFYFSYTKGLSEPYYCISCKSIKSKKTNITKYGFDNPMKSDLVKNTLKKSIMNKYGVSHYSKTDEYKDKYKKTCINKYGVDNISKLDTIKGLISEIKFKELNSIDKHRNVISEDYNILEYLPGRNFKILHRECNSEFSIFIGTLNDRTRNGNIICTNCNPVDKLSSGRELELSNFLKEYNIEFISNSYEIIPPLSLDIYIPDLNLAFEFNGVYWHSEVYKDKYYHLNKSKKCKEIGIDLTHIWEDDWIYKKDIIKSIILNKLGKTKNKIPARKCQVREIEDISTVRNFLNNNHIQGYSNSQKKLGLYYNGELVSLMIFGKRKKNIELIRFCNKLNFSIIGGSSKLFKYYINNYKFDIIESYSDSSIFDGNMYEKLGFKFKYNTPVNYWRVVDGIRKHRFNFNKKKLVSMGYDINLSENEILTNLKYYRIWGCGLKKWIYQKNDTQNQTISGDSIKV
jgi:hypothetical protein